MLEQLGVGPGDDMRADEFADALGGFGAGFDGGFDAADVAFDDDGDEAAADLDLAGERDAGRLDHGVAGFNGADVALGFNHSERFTHGGSGLWDLVGMVGWKKREEARGGAGSGQQFAGHAGGEAAGVALVGVDVHLEFEGGRHAGEQMRSKVTPQAPPTRRRMIAAVFTP